MRDATPRSTVVFSCVLTSVALASVTLTASCGGTVVFEEDGGNGGNGSANGSGNGSTSQASTPNAGAAGPGGVGGADVGATGAPSSAGVGGPGCRYFTGTAEYCYSNEDCDGPVREAECELAELPNRCWCFQDGVYLGECESSYDRCDAPNLCCLQAFPP
jgi:hypothetical protein